MAAKTQTARTKKQLRCPFSGTLVTIKAAANGLRYVESSWGWRSRLFNTHAEAEEWMREEMTPEPSDLKMVESGVRFRVEGVGWLSSHFQTVAGAEFWRSHRMGRLLKSFTPEPVISRVDPPEDPIDTGFDEFRGESKDFEERQQELREKAGI